MTGAAVIFGLGALALALLGGGSRRSGAGGQVGCQATPQVAARATQLASLIAWIQCAERTPVEVAQLTGLLDRNGRAADAAAIRAAWNERLAVDRRPADGFMFSPQEAAAARAAAEGDPAPSEEPPERRGHVTFPTEADIERIPEASSVYSPPASSSSSGGGFSPAEARRLAPTVDRSLRSGGGYRTALISFQRAAGIPADGLYGPQSRAALRYYGIANPVAARVNRSAPEVYSPPAIRTEDVSVSGTLSGLVSEVTR